MARKKRKPKARTLSHQPKAVEGLKTPSETSTVVDTPPVSLSTTPALREPLSFSLPWGFPPLVPASSFEHPRLMIGAGVLAAVGWLSVIPQGGLFLVAAFAVTFVLTDRSPGRILATGLAIACALAAGILAPDLERYLGQSNVGDTWDAWGAVTLLAASFLLAGTIARREHRYPTERLRIGVWVVGAGASIIGGFLLILWTILLVQLIQLV